MALGADRAAIRKLVVWQDEAGAGRRSAGHGAAFGLTRLIASFSSASSRGTGACLVTVPMILVAVALLAVWLPATRASKLDPMQALRVE